MTHVRVDYKFFMHVFICFSISSLIITAVLLYYISQIVDSHNQNAWKLVTNEDYKRPQDEHIWSHDPMVMQGLAGVRARRTQGTAEVAAGDVKITQVNFNDSCFAFVWTRFHQKNLLKYKVTIRNIKVPTMAPIEADVRGLDVQFVQCSLNVSTPYMVTLTGVGEDGVEAVEAASQVMWTTHQVPPPPDQPKIISVTQTTITVTLPLVILTEGPLTALEIRMKPAETNHSLEDRKAHPLFWTSFLMRHKRSSENFQPDGVLVRTVEIPHWMLQSVHEQNIMGESTRSSTVALLKMSQGPGTVLAWEAPSAYDVPDTDSVEREQTEGTQGNQQQGRKSKHYHKGAFDRTNERHVEDGQKSKVNATIDDVNKTRAGTKHKLKDMIANAWYNNNMGSLKLQSLARSTPNRDLAEDNTDQLHHVISNLTSSAHYNNDISQHGRDASTQHDISQHVSTQHDDISQHRRDPSTQHDDISQHASTQHDDISQHASIQHDDISQHASTQHDISQHASTQHDDISQHVSTQHDDISQHGGDPSTQHDDISQHASTQHDISQHGGDASTQHDDISQHGGDVRTQQHTDIVWSDIGINPDLEALYGMSTSQMMSNLLQPASQGEDIALFQQLLKDTDELLEADTFSDNSSLDVLRATPLTPGVTPLTPGVTPRTPGVTPLTPGVMPLTPDNSSLDVLRATPLTFGVTPLTPGVTPLTPGVMPLTPDNNSSLDMLRAAAITPDKQDITNFNRTCLQCPDLIGNLTNFNRTCLQCPDLIGNLTNFNRTCLQCPDLIGNLINFNRTCLQCPDLIGNLTNFNITCLQCPDLIGNLTNFNRTCLQCPDLIGNLTNFNRTCLQCPDLIGNLGDGNKGGRTLQLSTRSTSWNIPQVASKMNMFLREFLDKTSRHIFSRLVNDGARDLTRTKRSVLDLGRKRRIEPNREAVREIPDALQVDPYQTLDVFMSATGESTRVKTGYGYFITDHYGVRQPYFNNSQLERGLRRHARYQEAKDFVLYGKSLLNLTDFKDLDLHLLFTRLNTVMEINRLRRTKVFLDMFEDFLFWNEDKADKQLGGSSIPHEAKLGLPPGLPMARVIRGQNQNVTIGDNSQHDQLPNPPLEPGKQYEVVVVVLSTVVDVTKHSWTSINVTTLPEEPRIVSGPILVLLGIVVTCCLLVFVLFHMLWWCTNSRPMAPPDGAWAHAQTQMIPGGATEMTHSVQMWPV